MNKHKRQYFAQEGTVLCLTPGSGPRLWGKDTRQRLATQFARCGVKKVIEPEAAEGFPGPVVMLRGDAILDEPLIVALLKQPGLMLTTEDGRPVGAHLAGGDAAEALIALTHGKPARGGGRFEVARPSTLDAHFWRSLKKRETPYAFIAGDADIAAIEWRMFMGTYKGATDLVTKFLWPVPAFHLVRWLAPLGVTPNMVTSVAAVMVFAAFFLFLNGHYGWGLVAAWFMTFLDTVDGKLARTTLTSSKWGDYFDHGIDLIHPPFWYAAWAYGLPAVGLGLGEGETLWLIGLILGGYVVQRLMEGASTRWLKMTIHTWRKIDTWFRLITARRNPNLVILTASALAGRPDVGIVAVAVWTLICLALHGIQLAQAFAARRSGPLTSWMTERPGKP